MFWLLGPAEDGFDSELERIVAGARGAVRLGPGALEGPARRGRRLRGVRLVVLASTWEGFGNPAVESAVHRRPLAIGPYPVASELAAFGFRWFALDDVDGVTTFLERPDASLVEHNHEVARRHFDRRDLPGRIAEVFTGAGWDLP